MEFGDWEISEITIGIIAFVIIVCTICICDSKQKIEEEKTKQCEIQYHITYNQLKNQTNER